MLQNKPESVEHFVDPHWQAALLAVRPSSSLHDKTSLQILIDASQNSSDDEAMQSELPHLQSVPTVFEVIPFVTAQVVEERGEQELEDLSQYEPATVHP